jgi:hypothetical protein
MRQTGLLEYYIAMDDGYIDGMGWELAPIRACMRQTKNTCTDGRVSDLDSRVNDDGWERSSGNKKNRHVDACRNEPVEEPPGASAG